MKENNRRISERGSMTVEMVHSLIELNNVFVDMIVYVMYGIVSIGFFEYSNKYAIRNDLWFKDCQVIVQYSVCYLAVVMIGIGLLAWASRIERGKRNALGGSSFLGSKLRRCICTFCWTVFLPLEYLVHFLISGCASLVILTRNKEIFLLFGYSLSYWAYFAVVVSVFSVVHVLSHIKISLFRSPLLRILGFFSQGSSKFESAMMLSIPISCFLITLRQLSEATAQLESTLYIYELIYLCLQLALVCYLYSTRPFFYSLSNILFGINLTLNACVSLFKLSEKHGQRSILIELNILILVFPVVTVGNWKYFMGDRKHTGESYLKEVVLNPSRKSLDELLREARVYMDFSDGGESKKQILNKGHLGMRKQAAKEKESPSNSEEILLLSQEVENSQQMLNRIILGWTQKYELKKRNDPYFIVLKLEYLLKYHQSTSKMLKTLSQLKSMQTTFQSELIRHIAGKQLETFYHGYYYTSFTLQRKFISEEDNIKSEFQDQKNEKNSNSNRESLIIKNKNPKKLLISISRPSQLDIGYAFFYRAKLEKLVKSILEFTEISKNLMSLIKDTKGNLNSLMVRVHQLYDLANTIDFTFTEFDSFTKKVEYLHFSPYIFHLNFNLNKIGSARKFLDVYAKRVSHFQSNPDLKSISITKENLFFDTLFLLIESESKHLGRILQVYGNYHLFFDNHSDIIGKQYDVFLTENQKSYHQKFLSELHSKPLSEYKVIGATLPGFIKLPNKDYVAFGSTIVKIMPFLTIDFKYVVGVKPRIRENENSFYILLDENLDIDAYSYNFLHILPEAFIQPRTSLKQLSSSVYRKLLPIRDRKTIIQHTITRSKGSETPDGVRNIRNRGFVSNSGSSNQEEQSRSRLVGDQFHQEYLDAVTVEDYLVFSNEAGRLMRRRFIITFQYKGYIMSNDGYWFLSMVLNEPLVEKKKKAKSSDSGSSGDEEEERDKVIQKSIEPVHSQVRITEEHLIEDVPSGENIEKNNETSRMSDDVISLRIPDGLRRTPKMTGKGNILKDDSGKGTKSRFV